MIPAIEIHNVSKSFGDVTALKEISLSVGEGELFGLIGPDGSGKSTMFRLITTLLLADSGTVRVLGRDAVKEYRYIRENIGYMPGRFSLYQDLTVEENLDFFASIFKTTVKDNYDLIKDIYEHIEPFRKRKAGNLSGGMKQKLALSCALIHKPKLLVLDEPTTGVDAVSRKEFWDMLKKLVGQKLSIIVSTPYMDEAVLCDRIALIQKGSIMNIGTPEETVSKFPGKLFKIIHRDRYPIIRALRAFPYSETVYPFGDSVHYTDKRENAQPQLIAEYLVKQGFHGIEVIEAEAGIEDTFMALMRGAQDE